MPQGDKEILKADPEDGTTPIANLLLEALAVAKLTGKEKGVLLYLWRATYGWCKAGARLKEREIPLSKWARVLQVDESKASQILSRLVGKQIITRKYLGAGKSYVYSTNTRVAEWDKSCQIQQGLLEMNREVLPKTAREDLSKTTIVPDTKIAMPKEIIKENTKKNIYILVFNHWNQQGIIFHKKLTDDIRNVIVRTLRSYSVEEVKSAISNYAEILKGSEYYFKYKWTLRDFLKRGIEKFMDIEVAKSNFRRDTDAKTKGRGLPKTYTPSPNDDIWESI